MGSNHLGFCACSNQSIAEQCQCDGILPVFAEYPDVYSPGRLGPVIGQVNCVTSSEYPTVGIDCADRDHRYLGAEEIDPCSEGLFARPGGVGNCGSNEVWNAMLQTCLSPPKVCPCKYLRVSFVHVRVSVLGHLH